MKIQLSVSTIKNILKGVDFKKTPTFNFVAENGECKLIMGFNDEDIVKPIIISLNNVDILEDGSVVLSSTTFIPLLKANAKTAIISEGHIVAEKTDISFRELADRKIKEEKCKSFDLDKYLNVSKFTMTGEEFKKILDIKDFVAARDAVRPSLASICLRDRNAVALDGYTMATIKNSNIETRGADILLYPNIVKIISKFKFNTVEFKSYFDNTKFDNVKDATIHSEIKLDCGTFIVHIYNLNKNNEFIAFDSLAPKEYENYILLEDLKEKIDHVVKTPAKKDVLNISLKDDAAEFSIDFDADALNSEHYNISVNRRVSYKECNCSKDILNAFKISLNVKYVAKALSKLGKKSDVKIKFTGITTPTLWSNKEDNLSILILPIRIAR